MSWLCSAGKDGVRDAAKRDAVKGSSATGPGAGVGTFRTGRAASWWDHSESCAPAEG